MGYCVRISFENVTFEREQIVPCLAALNKALIDEKPTYMDIPDGGFKSLVAVFDEWTRDTTVDDVEGTVAVNGFGADKWYDEELLYAAIGPYVNRDAVITLRGEDGETWRYVFTDGEMQKQTGVVTFEDV